MRLHPRRWRYGYAWITLGLFLFSFTGHWVFAWFAYTSEQLAHDQPIQFSDYLIQVLRDTLENWQSEFLQLLWQVGGLALFLHLGSPQSKEGSDRVEEKIDAILRRIDPESGDRTIAELDRRFERQPDDPPEHRFRAPDGRFFATVGDIWRETQELRGAALLPAFVAREAECR